MSASNCSKPARDGKAPQRTSLKTTNEALPSSHRGKR